MKNDKIDAKADDRKKIKDNVHKGHRQRMRNKFLSGGIDVFDDHQLLEYLMFSVHKVKDTNPIGHALINRFGSLKGVFEASYEELINVEGVGDSGAALIMLISQLSNRISRSEVPRTATLYSVQEAGDYCKSLFYGLKEERLIMICIDSARNVISWHELSRGVTNATVVDIRKIVEIAMSTGASGIILSHNHPGDTTNPSGADISVTNKIVDILEAINIAVIDHIICNDSTFTSMSERGFMDIRKSEVTEE